MQPIYIQNRPIILLHENTKNKNFSRKLPLSTRVAEEPLKENEFQTLCCNWTNYQKILSTMSVCGKYFLFLNRCFLNSVNISLPVLCLTNNTLTANLFNMVLNEIVEIYKVALL